MRGKSESIFKTLEWLAATIAIAASTVFGIMRFAYSDFETQRNSDLYRDQIEIRLEKIEQNQDRINDKLDRIIVMIPKK